MGGFLFMVFMIGLMCYLVPDPRNFTSFRELGKGMGKLLILIAIIYCLGGGFK